MSQCKVASKVVDFKIKCPVCSEVIEIEAFVNSTTSVEECCLGCDVELGLSVYVSLDVELKE